MTEKAPIFADWPTSRQSSWITGGFGDWYTSPNGNQYQHRGTDFGCPQGTSIANQGPRAEVVKIYREGSSTFGNAPVLDYGPGYRFRFGVYAHCRAVFVRVGDTVDPGALVAESGNTGLSSGPHVHWQISEMDWFPIDIAYSTDPLAQIQEENDMTLAEDIAIATYAHPSELEALQAGTMTREEVLAKATARVNMIIGREPEHEPYAGPFFAIGDHTSLPKHGGAADLDHEHGGATLPHKHEPGEVIP
jgi:murein DD-endopeptidase MepM/ murein hydrolase activator NlpD